MLRTTSTRVTWTLLVTGAVLVPFALSFLLIQSRETTRLEARRQHIAKQQASLERQQQTLRQEQDRLAGQQQRLAEEMRARQGWHAEQERISTLQQGLTARQDSLRVQQERLAGEQQLYARQQDAVASDLARVSWRAWLHR